MHGRASEMLSGFALNDTLSHQTFILAHYLKSKYAGKMIVQLDLLHREYLEEFPQVVNTFMRQCALKGRLPDLLDTIIIEETGRILPVAYGFAEQFTMGNVYTFQDCGFAEYIEEKIPLIRKIYDRTLHKIFQNKETDIVNWNELVVNESKAVA